MSFIVNKTSLNTSYEFDVDPSRVDLYSFRPNRQFAEGKKILSEDFKTLLKADQIAYAARFNTLISLGRDESDTGNLRPLLVDNRAVDPELWDMIVPPMLYTIPSPIPGSDGVTGTNSSNTLETRGGLMCWSRGTNVLIQYRIQRVTLNGTGAITLQGSPSYAITIHGPAYSWEGAEDLILNTAPFLMFPAGSSPGDIYRIIVSARQIDEFTEGKISAILVHETPLSRTKP